MEKHPEDTARDDGYYDKKPRFVDRGPSKLRQTWDQGKVYFFVVAASLLFYFALLRVTNLTGVFQDIISILMPIIIGIAIAYLVNPLVKRIENFLRPIVSKRLKKEKNIKRFSRGIGVAISLIFIVLTIVALCNMVIPELYKSIRNLVITLPNQLNEWLGKLNEIELDNSTLGMLLKNVITDATETFQQWLTTDLLKQSNVIMLGLTEGVINVVSGLFNLLMGLIISAYLLFSKEQFSSQSKKILYAFLKPEYANMTLHITKKSNEIFGGFIIGKIIDSAIIGVLCFLGMWVFKMPYAMLISVIVGITNIIPFFGPYIGAIPSAMLILLVDPRQGIYFIIFIIILQQLDGNVIGPKILGNSTGLSAFWVMFAILLGGGLFGFVGMIIGVPTFAVIYYIAQMIINQKLEKKNLPTHSAYYDPESYVNAGGNYSRREEVKKEEKEEE